MVGRRCITCAHNLRRQQVSFVNQSVREFTVDGADKLLGCTVNCHRSIHTIIDTDRHNHHQDVVTMHGHNTGETNRNLLSQ